MGEAFPGEVVVAKPAVCFLALVLGCGAPVEPAVKTERAQVTVNPNPKDKVDLLFLIDNSGSMDAMQAALRERFFYFFKPFDELAKDGHYVDFHIGVVTSDYGAGATGAPGCEPSPGGQRGILQAIGVKADPSCLSPTGARFIEYSNAPGAANNLPAGQDLATTFTCMASVGSMGCGMEHQMESVHAALKGDLAENAGFIRPDAALAVAFVTNEDDASAPPDTDIFDKSLTAEYGYEASYSRQTRLGIVCCPPGVASCRPEEMQFPPYGDSAGPLSMCRAAPNPPGRLYDIRRYIDFFTLPARKGGVKANPDDVILYALDAPDDTFQVILSNPGSSENQQCPQLNESSNPPCVPVLRHSCKNPDVPGLFGDPAVRLNTVVRAVAQHRIWSICDGDYADALQHFATAVTQQLGAACLPSAFALADPVATDCTAADVQADIDQQLETPIPRCDGLSYPCWRLESKSACDGMTTGKVGLTIDRKGQPPPANTFVRASCTVPQ